MKIQSAKFRGASRPDLRGPRRSEGGSAVFVCVALLAIMVIFITANSGALFHLRGEINLLEQQQVKRLNTSQTNASDRVTLPMQPESK